jgi:hypothetical protein
VVLPNLCACACLGVSLATMGAVFINLARGYRGIFP